MLNMGKAFLVAGQHGEEKVIEGYIQNVDQIGVMFNSQSDGKGVLSIYFAHNVYKVEVAAPKVHLGGIVMPGVAQFRRP